jgi:DME family drug/metabolite transporter
VAIVVAAASWGTIGLANSYLPSGADPVAVAAARTLVGGLALAGYAVRPASVRATITSARCLRLLVVSGCAMACYQVAYFAAIAWAGPGIASVVTMSSVPIFTGVLCGLTGHRPALGWWCRLGCAVVGCGLLGLHGLLMGCHVLAGIGCALVASLLYALFISAVAGVIRAGGPPRTAMGLVFAGAGLMLAPYLVTGSQAWLTTSGGLAVVVYLGVVATAAAYLLYAFGLRFLSVPVAATLTLAEPACATILAVVVLGDRLTVPAWAGLVLLTVTLTVSAIPTSAGSSLRGRHVCGRGQFVAGVRVRRWRACLAQWHVLHRESRLSEGWPTVFCPAGHRGRTRVPTELTTRG